MRITIFVKQYNKLLMLQKWHEFNIYQHRLCWQAAVAAGARRIKEQRARAAAAAATAAATAAAAAAATDTSNT